MGRWTSLKVTCVKPAAFRIPSTLAGSASENGSGASEAGASLEPPRASSMARDHSFSSCPCQTIIHHQSAGGPRRPSDVGERGNRVREEHRPEPADGEFETPRGEGVDLRVGILERHVADSLRLSEFASSGNI